MNKIIIRQNEPKFIEYLKAQRSAYSQCKVYQVFDLISILMAIILPIIGVLKTEYVNQLGVFGVLWTIVYLVSENYRRKKTEQGAKIQEQFDTELYEISWNEVLCNDKVNSDTQTDLATQYKKNNLLNWYSLEVDTTLPKSIATILCQRINFSWEVKLRKRFVWILTILLLVYYGFFIAFVLYKNMGVYDMLILIAPSLSFLIYGVQNSIALKTHIQSKNERLSIIDDELDLYAKNKTEPKQDTLRKIQDMIFNERTVPEKIPDWFYYLNKKSNENRTDTIIKTIKNKF